MLLHNVFIDLGEPFMDPIKLKQRVMPIIADDDEDPCVRDAKVLRERLSLFVNEYYKLNRDGTARRIKEVGQL